MQKWITKTMSAKNRITVFPYTTISKVATKQGNSDREYSEWVEGMGCGWSSTQHPLYFLRTHSRVSFWAVSIWEGVIRSATMSLIETASLSPDDPAMLNHICVKPPFYVPLPDRVSGTGGRMFRAWCGRMWLYRCSQVSMTVWACLIEVNHSALRTSLRRVPLKRSL